MNSSKPMLLCRLGFHKWFYRLPDWGGDGHTLKEGTDLLEMHCLTCRCSWLQTGVTRTCTRGCGTHNTFQFVSDHNEWR